MSVACNLFLSRRHHFKLLLCHFTSASHRTPSSLASILRQCPTQKPLEQAHAYLLTSGHALNLFLSNTLIHSYFSLGLPALACLVSHQMQVKNLFTWTIMVCGYTQNQLFAEAVDVFSEMIVLGFSPNSVTCVSVLPACAHLGLLKLGRTIHSCLIRQTCEVNVYVQTALMDMYSKCGSVLVALTLFDRLSLRTVVSWNSIILCCAKNWYVQDAFRIFNIMRREGLKGDPITAMGLLSACSSIECLRIGSMVRSWLVKNGFEDDVLVATELINMYVNCGSVDEAYWIFRGKEMKDVVAWTLMIRGFMENGHGNKSMELFNQMMAVNYVEVDHVAIVGALSSCTRLGALEQGRRLHGLIVKLGFKADTFVGSALIDMYACCGNLESARKFFDQMMKKDVVCWNAMIAGHGMSGYGVDAVVLFCQMQESGIKPNEATFVCVLCACSHSGLVSHGIHIYNCMAKEWGIEPNLQHYACVIDLLGRAGHLNDAYLLIKEMELKPDASVLGALLASCRNHGNVQLGLQVSSKLLKLNPIDAGYNTLLSSVYAMSGDWDAVKSTHLSVRYKELKKTPGLSYIDMHYYRKSE